MSVSSYSAQLKLSADIYYPVPQALV